MKQWKDIRNAKLSQGAQARVDSAVELEISLIAARDVDGPRICEQCKQLGTVMLLMAGGWALCSACYREGEV